MEPTITARAESIVHTLAEALTEPHPGECLACYLDRMLQAIPCDSTLRLSQRYREQCAPRATALEKRLEAGGGFCDCEVLYNVYWAVTEGVPAEESPTDGSPAEGSPTCMGARHGSTKPCALWKRHRRGDGW